MIPVEGIFHSFKCAGYYGLHCMSRRGLFFEHLTISKQPQTLQKTYPTNSLFPARYPMLIFGKTSLWGINRYFHDLPPFLRL